MPAQSRYSASIILAFATFLERCHLTEVERHQLLETFQQFLSWKKDLSNLSVADIESFGQKVLKVNSTQITKALATHGSNANVAVETSPDEDSSQVAATAIVLMKQFIHRYPPHQISTFVHEYLLALKDEGCSPATIRNYRSDINQFWAFSQKQTLDELLTKAQIADFVRYQSQKDLQVSSIRRKVAAISQFALWAEREALLTNAVAWAHHPNIHEELLHSAHSPQVASGGFLPASLLAAFKPQVVTTPNLVHPAHGALAAAKSLTPDNVTAAPTTSLSTELEPASSSLLQYGGSIVGSKPAPKITGATTEAPTLLPTPAHPPMTFTPEQKRHPLARRHQEQRAHFKSQIDHLTSRLKTQSRAFILPYLNLAFLVLFFIGLAVFGYRQLASEVASPLAFPSSPVSPNRVLSFQGRLTDSGQNPIVSATNMTFRLYDTGPGTGGTELWSSGTCSIDPDQDGIFSTGLGSDCGSAIASSVFTENSNVWLSVTIGSETLAPRQKIQTVPYALNSETVQGYPITASGAATVNTILTMNSAGEVVLGESSPKIKSGTGTFTLEGQSILLRTAAGSNGNIVLDADGTGGTQIRDYLSAPAATFSATYAAGVPLTVNGGPSGTGNLTDWRNNGGTLLASITSAGRLSLQDVIYFNAGLSNAWHMVAEGTGFSFVESGVAERVTIQPGTGNFGIGTTSPAALLSVGSGSPFRVNSSGAITAATGITSSGNITFSGLNTPGGVIYAGTGGLLGVSAAGNSGECLLSGGSSTPTFGSCAGAVSNQIHWTSTNGALYPKNSTLDLFVGGQSTSSAKFAVINVNSGTPTATISGNITLNSAGLIQTTNNQTLTLGGDSTGNISFKPGNSSTSLFLGSNGNVGIGTTAPGSLAKLGVSGSNAARVSIEVQNTHSGGNASFYFQNDRGSFTTYGGLLTGGSADANGNLLGASRADRTFLIADGASSLGLGVGTLTAQPLLLGTNNAERMRIDGSGNVGIGGDSTPDSLLSVGSTSQFQVNSSGAIAAATGITSSGTITFSGLTANRFVKTTTGGQLTTAQYVDLASEVTGVLPLANGGTSKALTAVAGGLVYSDADSFEILGAGTSGTCLLSGGASAPTWSSCAGAVADSIHWTAANGAVYPKNSTMDLFVGGQATASAKFAVLNVNNGTPVASVSTGVSGNALYMTADGTLATANNRTLAINPTGGAVGIGTTAPTAKLEIVDGNDGSGGQIIAKDGGAILMASNGNYPLQIGNNTGGANSVRFRVSENGKIEAGNFISYGYGASSPGISFFGDSDTGVFQAAANALGISTGGTERIRFDSAGNVGIGTTAPLAKLEIAGDLQANTATISANYAAGTPLTIKGGPSGTGNLLSFQNSSGTVLGVFDESGNLGIGTTNPLATIDARSGSGISAGYFNSSGDHGLEAHSGGAAGRAAGIFVADSNTAQAFIARGQSSPTEDIFRVEKGSGNSVMVVDENGYVGIGDASPLSPLTVGDGDDFQVSATGAITAATGITSSGTITFSGLTANRFVKTTTGGQLTTAQYIDLSSEVTGVLPLANGGTNKALTAVAGGIIYSDADSFEVLGAGASGTCLLSGGSNAPTWSSCAAAVADSIIWQQANGTAQLKNSTLDLLVGGQATTSAKFAVLNVNNGTPVASVSSGVNGTASYITADGVLQTTRNQTLTIGGDTTGNITLSPLNGSGKVTSTGDFNLSSGKVFQINGTTVLSNNTLGSGVTTSSLTTVGALSSGSIANGFGTIATSNTITGTTINGTTGINTGASAGTQRIDATGNLVNIANITASGTVTFSGLTANRFVKTTTGGELTTSQYVNLASEVTGVLPLANGGTNKALTAAAGGIVYSDSDSFEILAAGASGQCLTSGGSGTPAWATCDPAGYWRIANGAISPINDTLDLLVGSNATASAKFAVLNVADGTPVASVSSGVSGNGVSMSSNGTIQTTRNQTLTIGGDTTGNIILSPLNGSGKVTSTGDFNLSSGKVYQINGTTVLSNNTLGSGVTTSSLTTVGALSSGSIANGFGTIATSNTITGTTINGTTGINTGASAGTQRIDASGNLVNIANITASGTVTFSGLTANRFVKTTTGGELTTSQYIDLTTEVTGVLPIANGGTNKNLSLVAGGVIYADADSFEMSAVGTSGQCLLSGGTGAPTWGSCASGTTNYWNSTNGALYPVNSTTDFFIGGQATASAKFAVLNVNNGTPVASVSSGVSGNATYMTADGSISTANGKSLALQPNGGFVGIGTTNPSGLFTIASGGSDRFRVNVNGAITMVGGAGHTVTSSGGNLTFTPSGSGNSIFSAGNVGIGTTTAGSRLTVGTSGGFTVNDSGAITAATGITNTGAVTSTGGAINLNASSNFAVNIGTGTTTSTVSIGGGANNVAIDSSVWDITGAGVASGLTGITSSGTITFSGLTANRFVKTTTGGELTTTQYIDLASEVTGVLPLANGGTNKNLTAVAGGIVYSDVDSFEILGAGTSGHCLTSGGSGAPSWASCAGAVADSIHWTAANGTIYPKNSTMDFFVGGQATASAKFAVLNVNDGTPVASVSSGVSGNGLSIAANGTMQTTRNQTLTIGGDTTGNITLSPLNGSGKVNITGDLNLSSGKVYQINGTTVLSNNTLGSGVVTSSLTTVGALSSGSIATGFGTIETANTITGTTINGTTGINTGASAGTQRIDSSGNLVNIGNLTSTGDLTINAGGGNVLLADGDVLNVGGATAAGYNFFGDSTGGNNTADGDSDLYIDDELEVNGAARFDGAMTAAAITASGLVTTNGGLTNAGAFTTSGGAVNINASSNFAVNIGTGTTTSTVAIGGNANNVAIDSSVWDITGAGVASGLTGLTSSGTITFSGLTANRFVKTTTGGELTTSQYIDLATEVTGVLPLANGGTSKALTAAAGGIVYSDADSFEILGAGTTGQCLTSGGTGTPTWGSCGAGGANYWRLSDGAISPANDTLDLLVGSNATASAKFAVLNVNNGTPVASVSSGVSGNATYMSADGTLSTARNKTLSINPNGGAVGIGTTTATSALYVQSLANSGGVANLLTLRNPSTGGSGSGAALDFLISSSVTNPHARIAALRPTSTHDGALTFGTSNASFVMTERMRIDSTGVVGIGTSAPTAQLHVRGNYGTNDALTVDQRVAGNILTASASGTTRFTIENDGDIVSTSDLALNGGDLTSSGALNITPTTTLSLNSTGDLTLDSSTDIILDADGADILFKDAGTTFATFTNSSTDLTLDIAGGNLLLANGDTLNVGGAAAAAYNFFAGDTAGNDTADGDNDLYIEDELEVNGAVRFDGAVTSNAGLTNTGTFTTAGGAVSLNASSNFAINIGTGTTTSTISIGGGANNVAIDSSSWDISGSGVASGFTGLTSSGTITFSGLTAGRFVKTTTGGELTTSQYIDLSTDVTGVLPLANGGTNKALTAVAGGLVYSDADSFEILGAGTSGQCLASGGTGAPTWSTCGTNYWRLANGAVSPVNDTLDLLVGSNASASAKFAVLNVNSGTPVASVSSGVSGNALSMSADGVLTTANNRSLQINPNGGRVGIGTTDPGTTFHVAGTNSVARITSNLSSTTVASTNTLGLWNMDSTANNLSSIMFRNSASGFSAAIEGVNVNHNATDTATGYLRFVTNHTGSYDERMRISSEGNVGVGTTSPIAKLNVQGGYAGNALMVLNQLNGQDIIAASASGVTRMRLANDGTLLAQKFADLSDSNYYLDPAATGTSMAVAGKVGIGTTAPVGELQVAATSTDGYRGVTSSQHSDNVQAALYTMMKSRGTAASPTTVANADYLGGLYFRGYGTSYDLSRASILAQVNGTVSSDTVPTDLIFNTGNGSTTTERLRITSAGYVGIGTSTPAALFHASTTSTTFPTSGIGYFDWSPTSATTTTGDVLSVNIGSLANVGNLFNVKDNGSSLFSVSETQITSALPHNFTAAGDISAAYDLQFTNQTASYLKSYGPLTIESGEIFENNNLTLKTYGTGDWVFDKNGATVAYLDDQGTGTNAKLNIRHIDGYMSGNTNTDLYLNYYATGAMYMGMGGGYVGVGTTAPVGKLHVHQTNAQYALYAEHSGAQHVMYAKSNSAAAAAIVGVSSNGSYYGILGHNGHYGVFCQGGPVNGCGGNQGWSNLSDQRLKENVEVIAPSRGLDAIMQLRPVAFDWKDAKEKSAQGRQLGFIAQELEQHFPEFVGAGPITTTITLADGTVQEVINPKSITYSNLVVPLVRAIQEQQGQIEALKTNTPVTLSDSGLVVITKQGGTYAVATPTGSAVTQVVAFSQAAVGTIRAGLVNTQELLANTITVTGDFIANRVSAPQLDTDTIAPVTGDDIAVKLESDQVDGTAGQLKIVNELDQTVASVDGNGNANFTGTTQLGSLITRDASVSGIATFSGEVNAASARIATLESRMANLEELKARTADFVTATISGTLYADDIYNFQDKVATAMQEPSLIAQLLGQVPEASASANLDTLYNIVDLPPAIASGSGLVNKSLADLNLSQDDVTLGASALFINNYFEVNGSAYVAESLGVGQSLLIGQGTRIEDGIFDYINAADPSASHLAIQPQGRGSISLLAGLVTLNENGIVSINGNLEVAGNVTVKQTLLTDLMRPTDFAKPLQVQVAGAATDSADIRQSRFEITNELNNPVATVSATGKADFAGGISVAKDDFTATTSALLVTNKTSGKATIKQLTKELVIHSNLITADSLIYVTPIGSTGNKVMYVKAQTAEDATLPGTEGSFTVGFDSIAINDVNFTWWIVQ